MVFNASAKEDNCPKQAGDTSTKNVGLYFGPHQKTNAINLIVGGNTKSANTAAMYVIPEGWDSISENSSIQNKSREEIKLTDVLEATVYKGLQAV